MLPDLPAVDPIRPGHDPSDMLGRILDFPAQLRAACELAEGGPDLLGKHRPARLWVVGMGGSAIGGDFVRAWARTTTPLPIDVVRGYGLPRSADASSFAIFVSYSGNTEETLSGWDEAARRDVPRACLTSGGELAARAEADGVPVLRIPGGAPPRSALGWTSVPLFLALGRAGLAPFEAETVDEAAGACERMLERFGPDAGEASTVRTWAEEAAAGLPLIYAPEDRLAPVVTRWVCQLNENAKLLAHGARFPEHNHNEIVGWDAPSALHSKVRAAFLSDDRTHPRVRLRMELVARNIEEAGGRIARFEPEGEGLAARLYSLAVLGDLASVYAASAREIDPSPVPGIDRLKAELARRPNDD